MAPISFMHSLSIKLDDKNYLLWSQQVEVVIAAHKLHRFVVSPIILATHLNEADRVCDNVCEEYHKWMVQDQMLFSWILSSLSDSMLPRVIGCKHSWQVWDQIHKHFFTVMKAEVRQCRSKLKNT